MKNPIKEIILAVEGLTVSFNGFKAVDDFSMYIDEGQIYVIIGPNGAGKTTVLDLICGKTKLTSGSIKFRNKELSKLRENKIVHEGVGRKFQNPSIYENLTVFENLELSYPKARTALGAMFFRRTPEIIAAVEQVAGEIFLADYLHTQADLLSHGQKQWLEIGMLLIQDPKLMMLDEPVAGMSVAERQKTAQLLRKIAGGRSVLVIEHDMQFVEDIADHVTVMHQEKYCRKVASIKSKTTLGLLTFILVIKETRMLKISDYAVAYGQSQVISGLNLTLAEGEIVALVGRNGMGKTTLMKSLIGMIPSCAGELEFAGTNITGLLSYQRVQHGIGFVPQGRMVFSTMTVEENIKTGIRQSRSLQVPEYLYDYFPVLKEMRKRMAGNLSGGQQQQLVMARALAGKPKLLLLDEPTEGIQPSIIKEMAKILRKIRDAEGLTILVSEQVLSFVLDVSDKIVVIEKGNIVHQQARSGADEEQIASYLSV